MRRLKASPQAKMKLSDDERRQLDELGISFDDDEEVFLSGRDMLNLIKTINRT